MKEHLRTVRFAPYRKGMGPTFTLTTWHIGRYTGTFSKERLAYRLTMREHGKSTVLFEGDSYGVSPMHAIDSNASMAGLMSFLTLRPGDTDKDYFASYTPAQLAFCSEHAEMLQMAVINHFGED